MKEFIYSYPTKVYFGDQAAEKALKAELAGAGKNILLAYGGGSVIDCCKIVAAQAKTEEDIWKMEFSDHKFPAEALPMGAIVTASGTGAEMNGGAVITNEEVMMKTGMMAFAPRFAVLDPNYTLTVPRMQVISGAFDTLSHAMETYFGQSDQDNVSDDVALAVMKNTVKNMRRLLVDINDLQARGNLMWDSAMAENGILKVGRVTDFQAHQMEHQLGAYTNCNHGEGLAVLHPVYYRHIYKDGLSKFKKFAVNVWNISPDGKTDQEVARQGVEALAGFIKEIGMPTTLRELGIDETVDLKAIADSCNIVPGSYRQMTHKEILEIFNQCL